MALPKKGEQLSLADQRSHGGPRPGSGRKAQSLRPKLPHRKRPAHVRYNPVHVTMRRAKGLPSFRVDRLHRLLRGAIAHTRRDGFRIVHYSIQNDHVHLLVEADDALHLTNGMKSFAVRVAMRVNGRIMERRRGKVWGDSYHRRELTTPSEVRSVLVYVLNNPCGTTSQVAISIGVRSQTFSLRHAEGWAEGLHRRLITLVSEGRAGPAS